MAKKVLRKDGSTSVCLCAYQVAACCQCENVGNSPENKSNILQFPLDAGGRIQMTPRPIKQGRQRLWINALRFHSTAEVSRHGGRGRARAFERRLLRARMQETSAGRR